jgi:asparagine synthase (glutamine-hydrolysing)
MDRPKHGFNVPVLGWVCGPLASWADEILLDRRAASRPYFDRTWVSSLLGDPARRRAHAYTVWLLVLFELWHRRYLDAGTAGEAA